ncbi:MAG: hypothetical protein ACXIUM_01810 [Wenzhouxiangella sp.]
MSALDREDLLRHRGQLAALGLSAAEIQARLDALKLGDATSGPGPDTEVFQRLVQRSEALGLAPDILADLYRLAAAESRARAGGAGGALGGILAVVVGALLVAAVVLGVMRIYVVPQLAQFAAQSGSELPFLTRLVFETLWFAPVLLLVPVLAAGAVLWSYRRLGAVYRLKVLAPAWMHRLPGLRDALARFRAGAIARVYGLLRAAGADAETALAAAVHALGAADSRPEQRARGGLARAVVLGTEAAEIAYWESVGDGVGSGLMAAFVQRLVGYFLLAVIALTVGVLVVALYLPLFGMGMLI